MEDLNPSWLIKAKTYIGLKEIPGPNHNSKITGWLRDLKAWWSDDETPWCGTFVAHCLQSVNQPIPKNWYRAKDWATYGSHLRIYRLSPGAILVFDRQGGGHVGFYVGESQNHYFVLGGNQSNGVNISRIAKARLIASRWPKDVPVVRGPIRMDPSGFPVTRNEA